MTKAIREVLAALESDRESIDAELRELREKVAALQKDISDLRERREELIRTRDFLGRRLGEPAKGAIVEPAAEEVAGLYAGKSIPEAAELFLGSVGQPPRPTREIADKLLEGGLKSQAKNLYATIFGSLRREVQKEDSRIIKVGTAWGLRDWYPEDVHVPKEEAKRAKGEPGTVTEEGGDDAEAVAP